MQKDAENKIDFEKLKSIGQALKKLRKEKGYSNYHTLAEELGMAHSQYSAYEAGSKNMTLNTLFKILNFHGVGLNEFVLNYCVLK